VGKPLFPGTSTLNQLERVLEYTGRPSPADVDAVGSPFAQAMVAALDIKPRRAAGDALPGVPPVALDLVERCLQFSPAKRPTVEEALRHPFVADFAVEADERRAARPVSLGVDDNTKFSAADYRDRLYAEIADRKAELKAARARAKAALAAGGGAAKGAAGGGEADAGGGGGGGGGEGRRASAAGAGAGAPAAGGEPASPPAPEAPASARAGAAVVTAPGPAT